MTKRLNSAEAIANVLGWDIADVKENRYKYGHTATPVFTAGDYYYCATTEGKEPARYLDKRKGMEWNWVRCPEVFPNGTYGWVVWKAHMER